ncbi:MAG TPA: ECF-type sigma factor [Woeseiaceae bacterium]|nr:ECF-type sigma factor [Woeseiaceae bacterium]
MTSHGKSNGPVTQVLERWHLATDEEKNSVIEALYVHLKQKAVAVRAGQTGARVVEPTLLVNEVYLKLVGADRMKWEGRDHFLNVAAKLMRQVVIDIARYENARKRERGAETRLKTNLSAEYQTMSSLLHIDALLGELATIDATYVEIVEARVFAGMTIAEAAAALSVSPATLKRKWKAAQIWLYEKLNS